MGLTPLTLTAISFMFVLCNTSQSCYDQTPFKWITLMIMKPAVIPPVSVEPAFLRELEAVLKDGETISGFVEAAVRNAVAFRQVSRFHERGEAAWERFQSTTESRSTEEVLSQLQMKLDAKRRQLAG